MRFRVGDAVRLKPGPGLCRRLKPWAGAVGRVRVVYDQLDDDDPPRIAVAFEPGGCTPPLPLDAFEPAARPEPGWAGKG